MVEKLGGIRNVHRLRVERENEVLSMLTEKQWAKLEEALGKPFDVSVLEPQPKYPRTPWLGREKKTEGKKKQAEATKR